MTNLIVARFADGRTVKGRSLDVAQNRPTCHVRTEDGSMVEIALKDLKALFFVKSLDGDSAHVDGDTISDEDARLRGAHLVEVRFHDNERIVGLAMRYPPNQPYFFLVPVDMSGNNVRILINAAEVAAIQTVKRG
ncbi:MAG: DUF6982 domain-containing protein [Gemmatimonadota bacterium]